MYMYILIRRSRFTGWSEPTMFSNANLYIFTWMGLYILSQKLGPGYNSIKIKVVVDDVMLYVSSLAPKKEKHSAYDTSLQNV